MDEEIEADIADARATARLARHIAFVNWSIGVIGCIWVVARALLTDASFSSTIDLLGIVGLASLTSGIALYVSSANLKLSADRLILQNESTQKSS